MHRSSIVVRALLVAIFAIGSLLANRIGLTENQIRQDIKFLSQPTDNGVKPSRLRALLLADLQSALLPAPLPNCSASSGDLTVTTPRCNCASLECRPTTRTSNYGKRSSSLIQRSCADYCCRQSPVAEHRSITGQHNKRNSDDAGIVHRCEAPASMFNDTMPIGQPPQLMPGIVQIYAAAEKWPMCLGTLLHARIVMTTLVCATMYPEQMLRIKVRETIDRYQFRTQLRNVTRRIYPQNYAQLFAEFGFNVALLVLAEPVHLNGDTQPACLAGQDRRQQRSKQLCFVDSLENRNGRLMERRVAVVVQPVAWCERRFAEQQRNGMFFPKSSLCVERADGQQRGDIEVFQNGAPLVCLHRDNDASGRLRYAQHGMLAWSTSINPAPHLFANVQNFGNWLDRQIADILHLDDERRNAV